MFNNAKNGNIKIGDTDMDYISFGKGKKTLVILPGVGDGLKTVKGTAYPFAAAYREYGKQNKVYVFSRKNRLEQGYTTKDMAKDQAIAMKKLGITKASIMGVSHGGMIAQYIAIDYPEMVEKLVLAVTLSRSNETVQQSVGRWIKMAEKGDYKRILIDTVEHSYSEQYVKKYRFFYPLLCRMGKPKEFTRFIIQAKSCLTHNAYDELDKITCPTLVIGGDCDKIVGAHSSAEIAKRIQNSKFYLYKGLGHGAYEEAKDFNRRVLYFFNGK